MKPIFPSYSCSYCCFTLCLSLRLESKHILFEKSSTAHHRLLFRAHSIYISSYRFVINATCYGCIWAHLEYKKIDCFYLDFNTPRFIAISHYFDQHFSIVFLINFVQTSSVLSSDSWRCVLASILDNWINPSDSFYWSMHLKCETSNRSEARYTSDLCTEKHWLKQMSLNKEYGNEVKSVW